MKTVIYKLHSSWKWNFYHRQKCKNGKLLQMDLKVHINICCTLPHTLTHTHHVTHLEDSSRSPRSRLSPFTSSRVTVRLSGLRGSGSSWPSGFANSSTKLSRKLWAPSCSFIPTAILWVWSNWWQVRLSHTGHFCNLPCSCSHLKRKRKKKKNSTTHKHSPHFPHSLTAVSLQCFVWTGLILRVRVLMSTLDRWNAGKAEACESELCDTETMPLWMPHTLTAIAPMLCNTLQPIHASFKAQNPNS